MRLIRCYFQRLSGPRLMLRRFTTPMILAFVMGGFGCHSKTNSHQQAALSLEPVVKVVKPTPRHMVRSIAQPGVIEAYEQTAVYPRVSG